MLFSSGGFHFQVKLEFGYQIRMRMETEMEVNYGAPLKVLLMPSAERAGVFFPSHTQTERHSAGEVRVLNYRMLLLQVKERQGSHR